MIIHDFRQVITKKQKRYPWPFAYCYGLEGFAFRVFSTRFVNHHLNKSNLNLDLVKCNYRLNLQSYCGLIL